MATLTINTTGAEDARIVAAFGKRLNLGRNATAGEVKQQIIQFVRNAVQEQEQRTAVDAAIAGVTIIDPT
jgi:hypothetical protein